MHIRANADIVFLVFSVVVIVLVVVVVVVVLVVLLLVVMVVVVVLVVLLLVVVVDLLLLLLLLLLVVIAATWRVFLNPPQAWASPALVLGSSTHKQAYVTHALLQALAAHVPLQPLLPALLQGVSARLESPLTAVRRQGMRVGRCEAAVLCGAVWCGAVW